MSLAHLRRGDGALLLIHPHPCDKESLESKLSDAGYRANAKPRTDYEALNIACRNLALGEYKRADRAVATQSLKRRQKNGLEVVLVDKGESGNAYSKAFSAKVTKDGTVECPMHVDQQELQKLFEEQKRELPVGSVRNIMEQVAFSLGGVKIEGVYGLYWLTDAAAATWADVFRPAFRELGSDEFLLPSNMDNPDNVRIVTQSVTDVVEKELAEIKDDLTENDLNETAVFKRQLQIKNLYRRMGEWEKCLGTTLDALRESTKVVDAALARDVSVVESRSQFADLFS